MISKLRAWTPEAVVWKPGAGRPKEGTAEDRKAAAARMEADSPQGQSGMEAGKGGATNGSYRPGLSRHRLGTRTMSGQPVKLPESKKSTTLFARLKVKFIG